LFSFYFFVHFYVYTERCILLYDHDIHFQTKKILIKFILKQKHIFPLHSSFSFQGKKTIWVIHYGGNLLLHIWSSFWLWAGWLLPFSYFCPNFFSLSPSFFLLYLSFLLSQEISATHRLTMLLFCTLWYCTHFTYFSYFIFISKFKVGIKSIENEDIIKITKLVLATQTCSLKDVLR